MDRHTPIPRFRLDNWLSARSYRGVPCSRQRACVVHPLLALVFLLVAALVVTLVVRSGVLDTVRTWSRLAAPTPTPHPMQMSDLSGAHHARL